MDQANCSKSTAHTHLMYLAVIASDRRERGNLMLGITLHELRSPRRFRSS